MSRWCSAEDTRWANGLPVDSNDPNYQEDSVLNYYIDRAQEMVLTDISILERDNQLVGSINGTNVYFYTSKYPISDKNFEGSISTNDVTVYGWGDLSELNTKTLLTVSAIDEVEGRVTLSSAPSSTYDVLTADYRWSMYEQNYTLVAQATAFMAGVLFFTAQYMEIPLTVRIGAQGYRYANSPSEAAWNAYLRTMRSIKIKQISVGKKVGTTLKGL